MDDARRQYLLVGMTGEDDVAVVDWHKQQIVKKIHTGRGAHNFRNLDDGKHVVVSNRVDSTISIIDYTTLTNVGDITGLMPGPDDMELTPPTSAIYGWGSALRSTSASSI